MVKLGFLANCAMLILVLCSKHEHTCIYTHIHAHTRVSCMLSTCYWLLPYLTTGSFFQALLFNPTKPFQSSQGVPIVDLMTDCFVASFRINFRNNQHFEVCFQVDSPAAFQLSLVKGLYRIAKEVSAKFTEYFCFSGHYLILLPFLAMPSLILFLIL